VIDKLQENIREQTARTNALKQQYDRLLKRMEVMTIVLWIQVYSVGLTVTLADQ
jgi:hypothetical protein